MTMIAWQGDLLCTSYQRIADALVAWVSQQLAGSMQK